MSNYFHRGFSLLELVAVLIITSVLAITAIPRFAFTDTNLFEARNSVLTALRQSRQVALMRAENNTSIRFIASANTIDIQENGSSIQYPEISYPITLPSGVTIVRGTGVLIFDKLGSSPASLIEISNGSEGRITTITGSGYAY